MATFKQNTAHANSQFSTMEKTSEGFGQRDETVLSEAFPLSPYLYKAADDVEANINKLGVDIFQGNTAAGPHVVAGEVADASIYWGQIDVEGAKKDIDINYNNAPDVGGNTKTTDAAGNDIAFGGGHDAPETPYVPPLTSPGTGLYKRGGDVTLSADVLAELAAKNYDAFGTGEGHENPSAQTINAQTLGSYVKGDS
jgi:hypothetical protein